MKIVLSPRDYNRLDSALEILDKYSRIFSALVKDENGIHTDNAGTAADMIRAIMKDSAPESTTAAPVRFTA